MGHHLAVVGRLVDKCFKPGRGVAQPVLEVDTWLPTKEPPRLGDIGAPTRRVIHG